MNIELLPGRYVVAVSGGVDSMVLLHVLANRPDLQLTVAHFNHGIRPDAHEDAQLVKKLAAQYGLPYVYGSAELGPSASEAAARQARYDFLHKVRQAVQAEAVVTAHHRDDLLETAILNIIRGTGRRGLTSLRSTDIVKRPLLQISKPEIRRYAQDNQIVWHEDSTNYSLAYKRNYVRHTLLNRFKTQDRQQLHDIVLQLHSVNANLDDLLAKLLSNLLRGGKLDRQRFIMLPHGVSCELMAAWLRESADIEFDAKLIDRFVHAAKTFKPGHSVHGMQNWSLVVERDYLALKHTER